MLRAGTEQDLTKLIFEYRLRNNIPIGDIESEINGYYCTKWPDCCTGLSSATHTEKLLDRITRWVALMARGMPRGGYKLAEKEVAETRAASCHGCPNNKSWRGGCAGCSSSVATMLLSLRQMRKTSHDGNLLGCVEFGFENGAAVWLPQQPATDEQNARLPERCWMKRK